MHSACFKSLRALLGATVLANANALAQPSVPYEIVDPGLTDSSALGESFRIVPIDLRTPIGFDRVFRLPTVTGGEMFARIDGGLTAVFPRSEYAFGQAVIPAGTTWYIGRLPQNLFGAVHAFHTTPAASEQAVSHRLDLRASTAAPEPDTTKRTRLEPVRNPLMPWSGELERAGRVAELLRRAARAERVGIGR